VVDYSMTTIAVHTHTYVNTIYLRVFHRVNIYFICYPFISFVNFCSRAYVSSAQRIGNVIEMYCLLDFCLLSDLLSVHI
jgi:hypothetical protein